MKGKAFLVFLLIVLGCEYNDVPPDNLDLANAIYYRISLNRSDGTFKVSVSLDHLTEASSVIQFAATAPGIYQISDFGRFIKHFKALDRNYGELYVSQISTNQWKISNPDETRMIEYEMAQTSHSSIVNRIVSSSIGTSIETDNVVFNPVAVLGYPAGLQQRSFYVKIDLPPGWIAGTSLTKTDDGYYYASSYGRFADGPIFMGELTTATAIVDGTQFNIFTYSKKGKFNAAQVVDIVKPAWQDASKFLKGLPVNRYYGLYDFDDDVVGGAMEHSFSTMACLSESVFASDPVWLRTTSAHEFFHIITPLTLHSEIIENFNFANPTASAHEWWYEGVTVWASIMMQYRNKSIDLYSFIGQLGRHGSYMPQVSLIGTSLNCYANSIDGSYAYNRGSMAACLLDIRLLELSHGTKGLRELVLELYEKYHDHPFADNAFLDILTEMTYPEIGDFLNRYVKGSEDLPVYEYFDKLGIAFSARTLITNPTADQQALFNKWSVNF